MGVGTKRMLANGAETVDWYEAPAQPDSLATRPGQDLPHWADLRQLLLRWEKLRLIYNAVLTVEVVLSVVATRPAAFQQPLFYASMIAGCIGANLCFCAGPLVDAYARWIGLRSPLVGYLLFGLGTLLAMILAAGYVNAIDFSANLTF